MNFTKIKNIDELKIQDKIAITNYNLEDHSVSSINLLIGYVHSIIKNKNNIILEVHVATDTGSKIILTDLGLKLKSVYAIKENKEQKNNNAIIESNNERLVKSNNMLIKKLEKSERLNRKYKAMLIKRFGATKEQIDSNFTIKNEKKKKEFIEYKIINDRIPCFVNGEKSSLLGKFKFSTNNKNKIKCQIDILDKNDKILFSVSSIATCDKEDIFNIAIGEFIASSKAIAKVVVKAH